MQIENFKCKGGSGWKRARLVNACESQASIYIYKVTHSPVMICLRADK